jgi:ribosome-associated heat shock protein Hsp15
MTSVRMDKWLWAARFFKTRSLAAKACDLGRIQSNGQSAKSGPASVAQTLYRETEASKEQRQKLAAERKAMRQFEVLPEGRPSKRDRRRIIQFRGRT